MQLDNKILVVLLNSLSVGMRMLSALLVNKLLALHLGPAGLAIASNIVGAFNILGTLAGGFLGQAATKVIADTRSEQMAQIKIALKKAWLPIAFPVSAIGVIIIFIFRGELLPTEIQDSNITIVLCAFLLSITLSLNAIFLGIFAGEKLYFNNILSSSLFSILQLVLIFFLVPKYDILGVTLAFGTAASFTLVVNLILAKRSSRVLDGGKITTDTALVSRYKSDIRKTGLASLVSLVSLPLVYLAIRAGVIWILDEEKAGYVQAIWRISDAYMLLFSSLFALMLLPSLSSTKCYRSKVQNLKRVILTAWAFFSLLAFIVFVSSDKLVILLYSNEFLPASDMVPLQLIGDFFKVANIAFGFYFISSSMVREYVKIEIFSSVAWVAISLSMLKLLDTKAIVVGHALVSISVFIVSMFLLKRAITSARSLEEAI